MDTIKLSEALPPETDRVPLVEGSSFAITGIVLETHEGRDGKAWQSAKINGYALPDLTALVKYKTSSGPVVRQLADLLAGCCYESGECRKPVRVKVEGRDGKAGRYLILVDA